MISATSDQLLERGRRCFGVALLALGLSCGGSSSGSGPFPGPPDPVEPPPDPPTPERFQATLGTADEDRGEAVYPTSDGGYLLAARSVDRGGRDQGWIVRVDALGREIESWALDHPDYGTAFLARAEGGFALARPDFEGGTLVQRLDPSGEPTDLLRLAASAGNSSPAAIVTSPIGGYAIADGRGLSRFDTEGRALWRRDFDLERLDLDHTVPRADGGFGLLGRYACEPPPRTRTCGVLIDLDGDGRERWRTLAETDDERLAADVAVHDASGGGEGRYLLAARATLPVDGGSTRAVLRLVDVDALGSRERTVATDFDGWPIALQPTSTGLRVLLSEREARSASGRHALLEVDADGEVLSTTTVDSGTLAAASFLDDGGLIGAGATWDYGAGSADVLLSRFDADGRAGPPPPEASFPPAASWREAELLVEGLTDGRLAQLVVDERGGAIALGSEPLADGERAGLWMAERRRRDARWSLSRPVVETEAIEELRAAALEAGRAMALWRSGAESGERLVGLTVGSGARDALPETVAAPAGALGEVALAGSPGGVAAVLWSERAEVPVLGGVSRLALRRFDGSAWAAEDVVLPVDRRPVLRLPRVALRGIPERTTLLWSSGGGGDRQLCGSTRAAPEAPFSAPSCVRHGDLQTSLAAFDDDGRALVVWDRYAYAVTGEGRELLYASFVPGGGFGVPELVPEICPGDPRSLALGASVDDALLTAYGCDGTSAQHLDGGAWRLPVDLRDAPDSDDEFRSRAVFLGGDRYLVVFDYSIERRLVLWATLSADGGSSWSEPEAIVRTDRDPGTPRRWLVAGNRDGDAVVAWQDRDAVRARALIR